MAGGNDPIKFRILTPSGTIDERNIDAEVRVQLEVLRLEKDGLARYFVQRPDAVTVSASRLLVSAIQHARIISENKLMAMASKREIEKREPVTVLRCGADFLILDGNSTYLNAIASGWQEVLCVIDG